MTRDEIREKLKRGGYWLGRVRSWIQQKKFNGSSVTWGSRDHLNPTMTVREVEEVCLEAAVAAIFEYQGSINTFLHRLPDIREELDLCVICRRPICSYQMDRVIDGKKYHFDCSSRTERGG